MTGLKEAVTGPKLLENIRACFGSDRVLFSRHARDEMLTEELGEIVEKEVFDAVLAGKLIEDYPADEPYPSCLIYGVTESRRPLHVVCAHAEDAQVAIVITVYEPNPERWVDFERRKRL